MFPALTGPREALTHALRVRLLCVNPVAFAAAFVRSFTGAKDERPPPFDASLLRVLVCPLSKKALRYDAQTNELINDELGIAYPVVHGIPNMIPQDARLIQKEVDAQ
ncbi:protein preY, mitochondrial-like [Solea solea]|uniref:protein preY, mitochondrial-like n=1 Tax=Solea solea TaxID=90069 RepID=UPI00272A19F7|nr:protein preY, mitochondrial-like [Solea solea]